MSDWDLPPTVQQVTYILHLWNSRDIPADDREWIVQRHEYFLANTVRAHSLARRLEQY